ncbi:hypothetical protein V8G54_026861, partial [Vigna mungo]
PTSSEGSPPSHPFISRTSTTPTSTHSSSNSHPPRINPSRLGTPLLCILKSQIQPLLCLFIHRQRPPLQYPLLETRHHNWRRQSPQSFTQDIQNGANTDSPPPTGHHETLPPLVTCFFFFFLFFY